jgi:hypothetical protein
MNDQPKDTQTEEEDPERAIWTAFIDSRRNGYEDYDPDYTLPSSDKED